MGSSAPDLPPSGKYLDSIRSTCKELRTSSNISISSEAIERLVTSPSFTQSYGRVSQSHGLVLPLKFPSPLAELNFISLLSLLNFASGYRIPLREQTGRGAWDSIRALLLSMFLSSDGDQDFLSAKGIKNVSEVQVAELMRVNIHIEKPHDKVPGITVGELGGPLYELVKLITQVLNETGSTLVSSGYPSLGAFVAEALREGNKAQVAGGSNTEVVLERLVKAFPALRDMAIVNGKTVYCFKKALFLIFAVKIRFGSLDPSPFPVPDTSALPVFTDNVLPSMLVHLGVLDLSGSSLASLFPGAESSNTITTLLQAEPPEGFTAPSSPPEGPLLTPDQGYILRAAAVDACELIIEHARSLDSAPLQQLTLGGLDVWLWAVAKDRADYRALPRFALRETVFF